MFGHTHRCSRLFTVFIFGVPVISDDQLPQCNIGFWPVDGNNSCYGFDSTINSAWSSCDALCIQIGGRCASIQKREENSELYALFQRTQPPANLASGYHIGLKENAGTWQWVDGTNSGNTFWASGYPRPGQTPYVSAATNGLWATEVPQVFHSCACRQKPIYQRNIDICPNDTYFGMGEIRSPGYPDPYAALLICTYTLYDRIVADLNPSQVWGEAMRTKLAIYFTAFNIHPADVVEVYDGADTNAPLIAAIHGIAGANQEYYSTGYNMTIRFVSNGGNGFKGWRALFGPYSTKP